MENKLSVSLIIGNEVVYVDIDSNELEYFRKTYYVHDGKLYEVGEYYYDLNGGRYVFDCIPSSHGNYLELHKKLLALEKSEHGQEVVDPIWS